MIRGRRALAILVATAVGVVVPAVLGSPAGGAAGAREHASSCCIDPYGPQGMNVEAVHSSYTSGSPDVLVAYVEGGINWYGSNASTLADSVYVNWHDTPVPCSGSTVATATMVVGRVTEACSTVYSSDAADYCLGASPCDVNASDWANDPRVGRQPGISFITPEDLIAAFSGSADRPPAEDPPGFSHAISGWDFYDGQNDPATVDGAYDHANDQMAVIHTICPGCTILPVKAGDEALDTTNDLAQAWLFAAESGARVIVSVTADLGYSSFARQVLAYVQSKGIVVVESSNDFDTPDHQGGMFWNGVLAGNGLVANTSGLPQSVWSTLPGPNWTRSDLTSWGSHAQFSVATGGGSTSESTPTLGAVVGLLLSEGDAAAAAGQIPAPLSGPQAVAVLESACSEPPGAPAGAWDELYGYGMPDVLTAMQQIAGGNLPPAARITSPSWYQLYDPTRGGSVTVTGSVTAEPGQAFGWQLQYGLGGDPQGSGWHTFASGSGTGSFSGTLGSLALSSIPASFWDRSFSATPTGLESGTDQYTVTFRVVATDTAPGGAPLSDEARLAVSVFHDASALPGFPLRISSSGDSQPALVDLQGSGRLDLVFGTADGLVEALDPATGRELPGWPAHTDPLVLPAPVPAGSGIVPGDEPVIADVAVGDLFHDGSLDVVATSSSGRVYAFDSTGHLLAGWPKTLSDGVVAPPVPRPDDAYTRRPVLGASAPPVLVQLGAGPDLDVVQAGWNGELAAWTPAGAALPGWPVHVTLPAGTTPPSGYVIVDDHKLDTPPVVARFGKSGAPDLVIRSQYTEIDPSRSLQPIARSFTFAYSAAGKLVAGWPVTLLGAIEDYGSAQEMITEGTDAPVAADVLGTGVDEVAVNPVWTPPYLVAGNGTPLGTYGNLGDLVTALQGLQNDPMAAVDHTLPPGVTDTPFPFASSGAFGSVGGRLVLAQPEIGAESMGASLLYPGTENHINSYISAWPAAAAGGGAASQPARFPSPVEGQGFLAAPAIADVSGGGTESIVVGGDASALSAVLPDGKEAPGFPKFTGGWSLYAPAAGDLFGTGRTDLVSITREGYLFAWSTGGSAAADDQWWRTRHDDWNTGNYGIATRPPGVVRDAEWAAGSPVLTFDAPGSAWYDGKVGHYDVTFEPSGVTEQVAPRAGGGSLQSVLVPEGTSSATIRGVGPSGLLGGAETVRQGLPGLSGPLPAHVAAIASTADGHGWWLVSSTGAVYAFGDARYRGGERAGATDPVVGIAATPDGGGYWLTTASGRVGAFGDAAPLGSAPAGLAKPVVGIAAAPAGQGYWLVAGDGGVFAFGAARFHGSAGGTHLNAPVVGMAAAPGGGGYWLVAADGGVFSYGGARFHGSAGAIRLNAPVVAMTAAPGGGYWLASKDGGIFSFGPGAAFAGSAAPAVLPAPIVGIAPAPGVFPGYRLADADGPVYTFGPAAAGA